MSLLRVIGYGVLTVDAFGSFGWPLTLATSTSLGLLASGVLLASVPRIAGSPSGG